MTTVQRAKSVPHSATIHVAGTSVSLSENIKILGIVLDSKLSFNYYIVNLSKSCFTISRLFDVFVKLLQTTSPRPSRAHWLVSASTTPTSYLLAPRKKNIGGLHRIQSTLARVVAQQRERISITKTFKDLHWLPVEYRIDLKMATFTVR